MKSGFVRHTLTLLLIVLSFVACKKEGPQGPQGPTGNANVKGDTIKLTNSNWLYPGQWELMTSTGSYLYYPSRYADIPTTLITADIINKGSVAVYFKPSKGTWAPLPYSILGALPAIYYNFMYEFKPGNIRVHYFWSNGPSTPVPSGLGTFVLPNYTFKYVVTASN